METELTIYARLLGAYLNNQISGPQFERDFLLTFKADQQSSRYPRPIRDALEALFGAVDAYCGDAILRQVLSRALDDEALRIAAAGAAAEIRVYLGEHQPRTGTSTT